MPGASRLPAIALLAWLMASCGAPPSSPAGESGALVARLARIARLHRSFAPRLSIPVVYQPCGGGAPDSARLIPELDCPVIPEMRTPSRAVLDLSARVATTTRTHPTPDALHAAALLDLAWGSASDAALLQRSIGLLNTAARVSPGSSPILCDLAAAQMLAAERTQDARHLLQALDAEQRGLRLDPRSAPLLFDFALTLDALGLMHDARRAWRAFLAVDSLSPWAGEARHDLARDHPRDPPRAPAVDAPDSAIVRYAAADPENAGQWAWDRLLDAWSAASLHGDHARAERLLAAATVAGRTLRKRGGAPALSDQVALIRSAQRDPRRLHRLALAQHDFDQGRRTYRQAIDYGAAEHAFARAVAESDAMTPLHLRALLSQATALVYQRRTDRAEGIFHRILRRAQQRPYPALLARARWSEGTTLARAGHFDQALSEFTQAAALFARIHERESLGAVQYLIAETRFAMGSPDAAASAYRASRTLRPYRGSVWLHNLLMVWATAAMRDGLLNAALQLQNEGMAVAEHTGRSVYVAEAGLARSRLYAAMGERRLAMADVDSARRSIDGLPPGTAKTALGLDLMLDDAVARPDSLSGAAIAELDTAIAMLGSEGNPSRLLPALVARAEVMRASGRREDAQRDLDRAIALVDTERASLMSTPLRAHLVDRVQRLVDQDVMLRVAAADTAGALRELNDARASLLPIGGSGHTALRPSPVRTRATTLEYALIGDTLLTWVIDGRSMRLQRRTVAHASLIAHIRALRAAMELHADPAIAHQLASLYDLLVRPVRSLLGTAGAPVDIVADGALANVPFAALYDSAGASYLVERHPLTLAVAPPRAVQQGREDVGATRMLVVADPAFDSAAFTRMRRLPASLREASAIAALYPGSRLLTGRAATVPHLLSAVQRADVFHFAGHAILDDERPDHSGLLLAADTGSASAGELTASEIERLDLHGLRLVVLSACETLQSPTGRTGGFGGLSGAFLAAGAGGVLGTLWLVDDVPTAAFMADFYTAYRTSGDVPSALRSAQLRLLRSSDRSLRSPSTWGAFVYAGR
ncbi:MAG TPA: CHAT domain-containing protein [Gemmatimonadaceae bacterium]|nr:CHAT domain-containing protein [Gemmatimonadaceae bacterium]